MMSLGLVASQMFTKNVAEPWMPIIVQISADYYPSIEHRFQTLGRILEDAIDRNYNLATGKDDD